MQVRGRETRAGVYRSGGGMTHRLTIGQITDKPHAVFKADGEATFLHSGSGRLEAPLGIVATDNQLQPTEHAATIEDRRHTRSWIE